MGPDHIIRELARNKNVFFEQLKDTSVAEALWKPEPDKWCLLEILCHLYDEEREDFRYRVKHVLETPEIPLPGLDPLLWVTERKYMEQDHGAVFENFISERERSIKWLGSLESPRWDNAYQHPKLGPMTAKLFLSNWLAHDYIHIRQILKVKFAYLQHSTTESLSYAGKW